MESSSGCRILNLSLLSAECKEMAPKAEAKIKLLRFQSDEEPVN